MGATWADARNPVATLPVNATGLLSPRHAAQWLDISRSGVYKLMADGTLPYVRIGNQRRIRVTHLERCVEKLTADLACAAPPTSLKVAR